MRVVEIAGHPYNIKANQAAKLRYRQEFGTSLTSDVFDLFRPLLQDQSVVGRVLEGGLSAADILSVYVSSDADFQDTMSRILWACVWSADRSVPDYDQWTDALQEMDESALGLFAGTDIAPWVMELFLAVAKAFLGIDLTESQNVPAQASPKS